MPAWQQVFARYATAKTHRGGVLNTRSHRSSQNVVCAGFDLAHLDIVVRRRLVIERVQEFSRQAGPILPQERLAVYLNTRVGAFDIAYTCRPCPPPLVSMALSKDVLKSRRTYVSHDGVSQYTEVVKPFTTVPCGSRVHHAHRIQTKNRRTERGYTICLNLLHGNFLGTKRRDGTIEMRPTGLFW